ncbi:patatin-like phospholipase family protein [Pontibacter ruber]|uniref:Patatin-like phospholipase family protein n=1 Tax=Pontibacter ruber TaxID=1343895 RepID=A0ABW5CX34_9BACT|nr:patatin-like phospholipase family protein [Pontibacter ruber]
MTNLHLKYWLKSLLLLICCCLIGSSLQAQSLEATGKRPRIGLVLSGGGAKGMAHIGFLKVMEQAGIKPDYITGTSMGALVGALYAIGYTPDEIEKIAIDLKWDLLLSNQVTLNQIAIEDKDYYGRYLLELPVNKLKIGFPSGMIEGQVLTRTLTGLTRSAHGISNFNKLPVPFACVATDLVTGEKVVLNSGFLAEAMRASMAIPSAFTPVQLNGRLLIDGGLVQNFPVQEALDMGADYIIGVNVGGALEPKQNLRTMVDVLVQTTFFTAAANSEKEKEKCDFLLDMVDSLGTFSNGSFNETKAIIELGEKSARPYLDSLKTIASQMNAYGEPMRNVKRINHLDSVFVEKVVIQGAEKVSDQLIERKLRIRETQQIALDDIDDRIEVLYGTGLFNKVSYAIVPGEQHFTLEVNVVEAQNAFLKAALYYDSENRAGATLNYTHRNLLFQGSRFVAEADLGQNIRSDLNYLKYMGYRQNFAARLGHIYYKNELPLFSGNGRKIAVLSQDRYSTIAGWQTTTNNSWTIGQQVEYNKAGLSPEVGDQIDLDSTLLDISQVERLRIRNLSFSTYFKSNKFNRQVYPTKGWRTEATAQLVTGNKFSARTASEESKQEVTQTLDKREPFMRFSAQAIGIFPVRPKLSIIMRQGMVVYTEKELPLGSETLVGGYRPVLPNAVEYWAVEPYAYSVDNLLYANAGLQYQARQNLYFQLQSSVLNTNLLNGTRTLRGETTRLGFGASVGYISRLGPLTAGIAREAGTSFRGFLSLGFRLPM